MKKRLAVLRSGALLFVALMLLVRTNTARADEALDRAAALAGTIDWVRQTGEDRTVPTNSCGRFLILCGPEGATFKLKSADASGGVERSFMWIGGRTVLFTQTKKRAIYLVLNPGGEIVRIAVVNMADGKERKIRNDDPQFVKLLGLEINYWRSRAPVEP